MMLSGDVLDRLAWGGVVCGVGLDKTVMTDMGFAGKVEEAIGLFKGLGRLGLTPTVATYGALVGACEKVRCAGQAVACPMFFFGWDGYSVGARRSRAARDVARWAGERASTQRWRCVDRDLVGSSKRSRDVAGFGGGVLLTRPLRATPHSSGGLDGQARSRVVLGA